MTLAHATHADGRPVHLPGPGPYDGHALCAIEGVAFDLPAGDPSLLDGPINAYLQAARQAWQTHPEWMDFLDLGSPAYDLKKAAADVYLHHWSRWIRPARVLDAGCGIGRMTMPFLDQGATVYGADADLLSLRRCAWYAARRPGRLDLSWTTLLRLPDVQVDVVIACESLCYLQDMPGALAACADRLAPGGVLLLSMEAEFGWALSPDAPDGGLDAALGGGPVDLPGDRFVHTVSASDLADLLHTAGFEPGDIVPTHYIVDGPLEDTMPDSLSLEELLHAEERARRHPVWGPLNRIWTASAIKR